MTTKFEELLHDTYNTLPKNLSNDDVVFVCIGTDRSSGDALAPIVGSALVKNGYRNVFGTLEDPVHAMNLTEIVEKLPIDKTVIAIDACLGLLSNVGRIKFYKGGIKPGAGVGKNLPIVGDYSFEGIVNVGGFMEYFVLQNTRLSLVMEMANAIADVILHRFPLQINENKDDENVDLCYSAV